MQDRAVESASAGKPKPTEPTTTYEDGVRHTDYRGVDPRYIPRKYRDPVQRHGIAAKLFTPSPALAAILGDEPTTRTRAVGALWHYIMQHGCQDPADRRAIVADDRLRPVFGADRVGMLDLGRILSGHLTAL